jgi:hypothetical protein
LLFPHNTTIWYDNDDDDNNGDDDEVSFWSLSPTAFAHPVPASHD